MSVKTTASIAIDEDLGEEDIVGEGEDMVEAVEVAVEQEVEVAEMVRI